MAIIVLGRSGSGKGTQTDFIIRRLRRYGVERIETGRVMRKLIQKVNPTTLIARKIMGRGGLMPAWFPAYIWLKGFIEKGIGGKHLVFDGAARRLWEAELLDEVIRWHQRPPPLVLYIDVTKKEATRRLLLRKRPDDTPKAIQNRLRFFDRDVLPVVRYYEHKNRIIRVNGNSPPAVVRDEIDRLLKNRLKEKWPLKQS